MVNVWGKEISEEELNKRWQRARSLKGFACFDNCKTYPHCNRLSSPNYFNELLLLRKQAIEKASEIIGASFKEDEYSIRIEIKCKESCEKEIDLEG